MSFWKSFAVLSVTVMVTLSERYTKRADKIESKRTVFYKQQKQLYKTDGRASLVTE